MFPKKAILYLLLSLFIIYDVASMVTATASNDTTQATVEKNKVNTNTSKIPDFLKPITIPIPKPITIPITKPVPKPPVKGIRRCRLCCRKFSKACLRICCHAAEDAKKIGSHD
ncbi:uncharacterized protein LOC111388820 [Olea europaea var. sylvestris]|uniref:uncharacterized protein LOC111388820 n=1 Tax=Olea europaea var. sylvestris TaxID=158386 RepID=UPI000C1D47C3|nr:uncharacterized protein LOC111388820 [Olea europaea var. sylvestris]